MWNVSSDGSVSLGLRILINKFIYIDVSPTHSNLNLILLINLQKHALGSEPIYTFWLSYEHDPEFRSIGILVDELCQSFIDSVLSSRDVYVFFLTVFIQLQLKIFDPLLQDLHILIVCYLNIQNLLFLLFNQIFHSIFFFLNLNFPFLDINQLLLQFLNLWYQILVILLDEIFGALLLLYLFFLVFHVFWK